ncbi:coiled-coil domain containing 43 [Phyllostomus discolor]|uniref:Coiled-coil domain-containing protein 43 n=1 Tax=Phyllostomus discolor TaxID=89673 RepID=A0A7E6EE90_9CHIR|nr:coiled-coil domain-containing protein 43 isoform X1 [Phyllostomus discolor]KAF6092782.1 coiled-coil domain containing 43 [Phyllostomus discolor]
MAAPSEVDAPSSSEGDGEGSGFGSWLDGRLEALGVDRAVYGAYILGVLQEEEEEEKLDALQGILSAFLEEDSLLNICKEIVERWTETQNVVTKVKREDEVQAIATLIEKQAQIVVKPRLVSEEEKQRKAALLAQYADVTDEEDEADEKGDSGATTMNIGSDKRILLCVRPPVLPCTILSRLSFHVAVVAVGSFCLADSCPASTASPMLRTALSGQPRQSFPQGRHANVYCKGVSLEEGFRRENKDPCFLRAAPGFPAPRTQLQ